VLGLELELESRLDIWRFFWYNVMMSSSSPTATAKPLNIPEEVQKKFPDLVELIKGSQSMNDEERQYWVDVLLIMTGDQVQNLRSILEGEKRQIESAKGKLEKEMSGDEDKIKIHFDEIKYKEKKRMLTESEKKFETEESKNEASILQEIQKM
jgi:hypothetical protein